MKTLFITIIAVMSFSTQASIVCHTPRSNKVFEIKDTKVTFFNEFDTTAKRELASVAARSKSSEKGVTKIVNFENQKHTIHIENASNFSDAEDYIIIKAKSGHEVTYPLSCQNK
ncbi:MAG: hypothetical protein EHM20_09700 [Alphaproteobacteria bacterium]|nr:MAG: hypothetical protein EHM20_09700 [Alphaproteobacteria bacterium]